MSWRERPYSRYGDGGGFMSNPLMYAPTIGHLFGIRIRLHMLFILYVVIELINAGGAFSFVAHYLFILFGSVFLHELGHCFAARSVDGTADDVLMWPLGGLATVDAPHAPWPQFVTVVCGPLVNVVLFSVCGGLLWLLRDQASGQSLGLFGWQPSGSIWLNPWAWLGTAYRVNLSLFLFNLWPMYPMDGGRMLECGIWWRTNYRRAALYTATIGMVAAIVMGLMALFPGAWVRRGHMGGINMTMLSLAIMGYIMCLQKRHVLLAGGEMEYEPFDSGRASNSAAGTRREGWLTRWRRQRRAAQMARDAQLEEAESREVDRILDKLHSSGLQSLTSAEKRTLESATRRQRDRTGTGH